MIWCIETYIIAYVKTHKKIRYIIHYVKPTAMKVYGFMENLSVNYDVIWNAEYCRIHSFCIDFSFWWNVGKFCFKI